MLSVLALPLSLDLGIALVQCQRRRLSDNVGSPKSPVEKQKLRQMRARCLRLLTLVVVVTKSQACRNWLEKLMQMAEESSQERACTQTDG